jgi:hypothetical protein
MNNIIQEIKLLNNNLATFEIAYKLKDFHHLL